MNRCTQRHRHTANFFLGPYRELGFLFQPDDTLHLWRKMTAGNDTVTTFCILNHINSEKQPCGMTRKKPILYNSAQKPKDFSSYK